MKLQRVEKKDREFLKVSRKKKKKKNPGRNDSHNENASTP